MSSESLLSEEIFRVLVLGEQKIISDAVGKAYQYGFSTDVAQNTIAPGLNESVIRWISEKKKEPIFKGK